MVLDSITTFNRNDLDALLEYSNVWRPPQRYLIRVLAQRERVV